MGRQALEVADIFRDHGPAWRDANRGPPRLGQLKVMNAIESCRTAALGGHVMRCENDACGYTAIAYNSCRNRHCPKCQGAAALEWMEARAAELLPVPYFHVVFTLPSPIGDIAYQNKAVIYDLLFRASAETMLTIAADPKHLGAKIGITAVLHSWGSAMTHHPHVHMIVPGGGISLDGSRWISKRPRFLLPVHVLSKLFRRLMIEKLVAAHAAGQLTFHGAHPALVHAKAFAAYLAPLKKRRWYVYTKRPLAGPKAVLAYLSRYTHRVAISNRRLIAADAKTVTFKVKDYRINGPGRYKTMTLDTHVVTAGGRGGGHLPAPRAGLACVPCRPREPRPTQGHVGDRALPTGGVGRACRTLRGLRPPALLFQLLRQPPLSKVPGRRGQGMAGRPPGRTVAGAVFPRRLHPAGADRRHRLSEQDRRL